jgi:hypothetical protein
MMKNGVSFFSLPMDIRNQLTANELQVFYLLFDLFQIRSKNFPGRSIYAFPSEAWLAQKVGCTRQYVSHCVQRLQYFKLITITHRRKVKARWQTNLYRFGLTLAKCLNRVTSCFSFTLHRVNKTCNIAKDHIINQGNKVDGQTGLYEMDDDIRNELRVLRLKLDPV